MASLRRSLRPRRSATVSRVRSSSVGPSPPLEIISGTRLSASRNASASKSRLSPTTVLRSTSMPIVFSSSVRKSELVSKRSGVSNSEPTAMISAFIRWLSDQWQAAHIPIQREKSVYRRENRASRRLEREPYQARSAQHRFRVSLGTNPHDAPMPAVRCRDVQVRVAIERQSLRTPKPAIKHGNIAALRDAVNAVVAGSGGAGYIQIAARMKRQVIRSERRLERRENENLPARANLENSSAAIPDVQIFRRIKRDARRDAHPLNPLFRAAFWCNSMNGAVVAARDKQIAGPVHGQARWIDQRGDKRFDAVIR